MKAASSISISGLVVLTILFLTIPAGFSAAQSPSLVPCGTTNTPPCQPCHFVVLLIRLINFGMKYLAIPLSILMFIWAGFVYAFSGGSPARIEAGKTILKNTVIGLLIVFLAYFAVDTAIKALSGSFQKDGFIGAFGPWNSPTLEGGCIESYKPVPDAGGVSEASRRISNLFTIIANTLGIVLMGISTIMILYAAWLYITAGGEEDKITTAKRTLIFALVGTAVALLAFSLPTFVGDLISGSSRPSSVPAPLQPGEGAGP